VELYPLTKPQRSIFDMQQYYGGAIANITGAAFFDEPVERSALRRAFGKAFELHNSLRIRIKIKDGTPMQYITPYKNEEFDELCFDFAHDFETWLTTLARTPLDMGGALCKIILLEVAGKIGYVIHLHHLIADAWTYGILTDTIAKYLKNELPERTYCYLDYIETEKEYAKSPRREKDKAYFLSRFEKCSEPTFLREHPAKNNAAEQLKIAIDKKTSEKIMAFCENNSISPYALFMNTLAVYIYRIKGVSDIYIGTAILNRTGKKEKSTAGMYINTVPMLMQVSDTFNILENIQSNSVSITGILRHQRYQYNEFLSDIREKYGFKGRLYDVVLSYQNAVLPDGVTAQWVFPGCQSEALNIHINDRQHESVYHIDYTYQTELLSQRDVERLHEHWVNIIVDAIENPAKKPQKLKMLSSGELNQVVYGFNDTAIEYPKERCVHQLFEEQVEKTPDEPALLACDGTLTFDKLNTTANKIANALIKKGIKQNDVVALILPRQSCYISAMLGILKSGGSYLPLDTAYPKERITFLLDDSKAKLTVTTPEFADKVSFSGEIVYIDKLLDRHENENPNIPIDPDSLFCALHTSGSTGTPKVAGLTHENINNFVLTAKPMFDGVETSLSTTVTSFDVFMQETLVALACGIKVVFFSEQELGSQSEFEAKIEQYENCYLFQTPTRLESHIKSSKTKKFLRHIRTFIVGGEVFPVGLFELIHRYNINTFNVYGPSESTPYSSHAQLSKRKVYNGNNPVETAVGVSFKCLESPDITIGKPIANTQIYILDMHQNPLPIGAVGELCISGDGVGRGYLNRPELTAEKFVPNPFIEGKRMYKTGDIAKWREDGNIEYVGRMDNQVKIRGLRIELGEIEEAMLKLGEMSQVAVVTRSDETGRQYICAFYSTKGTIDETTLRKNLAKTLPQYMIPHFFTKMDIFPTTPSGKTDRNALPTPDFSQSYSTVEYIAPTTKKEKAVVQILQAVLGISTIGMDDNFFDLGGDSLKAIEFVANAHHEGINIELQDVFEHPTPAMLIESIGRANKTTEYIKEDFDAVHWLLELGKRSTGIPQTSNSIGDVLITGATGWLGAHVLDEYLSSDTGTVYCLVRGEDLSDSTKKLHDVLSDYFGGKYSSLERIKVICGDITKQIEFDKPIDTIIHCAANVKHYGVYQDFYDVNVVGMKNVIELAKEKDALLIHISTMAVSGNAFDHDPDFSMTVFDESKLYIGQPLSNVYIRSKFEAEMAVLNARSDGLNTVIIRVGNLSNRRTDLVFQKNYDENATLTRLKAIADLGVYPRSLAWLPIEFSPVDDTARAVIRIAGHYDRVQLVYHAYHDKPILFGAFIKALKSAGIKMKPVSMKRFREELDKTANDPKTAHIFEAFVSDIGTDGELSLQSNIELSNSHTTQYLKQTGFSWQEVGMDYLRKYVEYFRGIGYFGV